MVPSFPGFPPEAMQFFRSLKRNNRREWFQPRKEIFDQKVKAPMLDLVEALNRALARFAPAYTRAPEEAVYRIYRDTRFAADKTPYKTHIAAIFPRQGLVKHNCGCFYFSVSPEEIEVAGGVYMPEPETLRVLRNYVSEHHEEFRRIARAKKLRGLLGELQGQQLARVPKGFCAEHPAADLVRYKQWYYYAGIDPALATTPKLLPEIVERFKALTPLVEYFNRPLGERRRPAGGEGMI
jgi:uncharacterized protein (TIGR02453 family)